MGADNAMLANGHAAKDGLLWVYWFLCVRKAFKASMINPVTFYESNST